MNEQEVAIAERLSYKQAHKSAETSPVIPIAEPLPGDWPQGAQAFPASYAQSRLWFLHQLQSDLTAYHLPALWRLSGNLDLKALRLALADLIERHPTLRTSFCLQGSEVVQIIHPPASFPLDAEPLGDRNPDAVIEQWLEQERTTPFDLASGQLLRARLLAVDHQHHLLLLNHHHIASDGWSRSVLVRDLTALYNARLTGQASELAPLQVQYHDYAAWQRQRLSGDRLQSLKDYWIPQLTGLEPLELPSDHPRPATPSHRGASVAFQITPELLAPFEQLCRLEGATLQMGLLALLALLLHRYSRQEDFAIGVPIWGRNHPDLEPLIGFFINTLPVRTRFTPEQSFRELLQQVKASSLAAYDHQELPFEKMVEALNLPRDTSRNPLVQVMLQLIELPEASLQSLEALAFESLECGPSGAKVDLEFFIRRAGQDGLSGEVVYAAELFDGRRIERINSHLLTLLASALEAPDAPADSLLLLPEGERRQIDAWQTGPHMALPELCLHQLFEQQVERTPDAIALIFENQQLTYAELNSRANRLARHLIDLGVGPDCLVAVGLERSIEIVVALLAILKAGGAYLPLDPSYPQARLASILQDSAPIALLVHGSTRNLLGGLTAAVPVVDLDASDQPWKALAYTNIDPIALGLCTHHLAYLIYTSGSTGRPKGVMNEHRGIVNRLLWMQDAYGLGADDAVLQKTPFSFDVSVWEFFWPLLAGARLVIARPGGHRDPRYLGEVIDHQRITTLHFVPSMLQGFLEHPFSNGCTHIRRVICSGEALSAALVKRFHRLLPTSALHNLYGPTEAAVDVTAWDCAQQIPASGLIPIGRPIANIRMYVLDSQGSPTPAGNSGELFIGGCQLARGYRNRPDLTAERFIADPFAAEPAARMYRTGDLARWLPDGNLEFLGRADFQIKLRGFRIEPGEIEAHLHAYPAVAQAVVLLRHDDPNNPRLIAYWVAHASPPTTPSVSSEQLRAFLAERLPDFMVPAALLQLQALPLTPNGKLDRKALPAPYFTGDLEQRVEPSTDVERQLHGIWAEVLGHSEFGCHDNFWRLGGHSLAAASLIVHIEKRIGKAVTWEVIYRYPTISEQTAWLLDRDQIAPRHLVTLQPHGSRPPLYIVHGWGGRVGSFTDLSRALAPDRPVLGLQASPDGGGPPPGTSVAQMTQDYADEIIAAHRGGPIHLMGHSAGGWYAYAVAAALLKRQAQVGVVAVLDTDVRVQIDPRLGLALVTQKLRSGLRVEDRAAQGQFRWRHLKDWLNKINSTTGLYFGVRIPAPQRLAAWLRGTAPPLGRGEPYVQLLMMGYRPPRLPLVVDLFSPQAHLPMNNRLWRFYALGGVRCWPLFADHNDYEKPELAMQLATALENALISMEARHSM